MKKKLVIVSSWTTFPWDGESLRKGPLGGSETAAIYVAEFCANGDPKGKRETFDTYVFCVCGEPKRVNRVLYVPLEMLRGFLAQYFIDVYVVYRDAEPLSYTVNVGKKFLWLQDISALSSRLRLDYTFENIVCLTPWHRTYFSDLMKIPESMIQCIGNAVTPSMYPVKETVKENLRFFYSSNPVRGLGRILDLWSKIRERFPEATLRVFTQLDHCKNVENLEDKVKALQGKDGVVISDRVSQEILAKEFAAADYWLYPTAFPETYCITALEAQLCGCICIYTDVGCLRDTVGDRGFMLKETTTEEQDKEILALIDRLESDDDLKESTRQKAMAFGHIQTWEKVGREWYAMIT